MAVLPIATTSRILSRRPPSHERLRSISLLSTLQAPSDNLRSLLLRLHARSQAPEINSTLISGDPMIKTLDVVRSAGDVKQGRLDAYPVFQQPLMDTELIGGWSWSTTVSNSQHVVSTTPVPRRRPPLLSWILDMQPSSLQTRRFLPSAFFGVLLEGSNIPQTWLRTQNTTGTGPYRLKMIRRGRLEGRGLTSLLPSVSSLRPMQVLAYFAAC